MAMAETLTQPPRQERLRVCWVAGADTFASMGQALRPLAVGLMSEMVELIVAAPVEADLREVPIPPVEVVHYPPSGWFRSAKADVAELAKELTRRHVDILHSLDVRQATLTMQLADLCSLPHVVSCDTFDGAEHLRRHDRFPDVVVAASDIIAADLRERLHLPGDRICLVRPGVHQDGRVSCFGDPSKIASIVIDGRSGSLSALEAAVRAFAEARRREIDCVCFLIGAGRVERRLRRLGESLQVRQELTYVDSPVISQMPGILSGADIYVTPRPTGKVDVWALMAMASGTVVLAADAPEDFFIDGRTVELFAKGDVVDLTEKLMGLLTDRDRARRLAAQAVKHVQVNHSPADMVAAVVGAYRKLPSPVGA